MGAPHIQAAGQPADVALAGGDDGLLGAPGAVQMDGAVGEAALQPHLGVDGAGVGPAVDIHHAAGVGLGGAGDEGGEVAFAGGIPGIEGGQAVGQAHPVAVVGVGVEGPRDGHVALAVQPEVVALHHQGVGGEGDDAAADGDAGGIRREFAADLAVLHHREGELVHRLAQLAVVPRQVPRLDGEAVDGGLHLQHLALDVEPAAVDGGHTVPPGVAGGFQPGLRGGADGAHHPGLQPLAGGGHHPDPLARRHRAVGEGAHRAGGVAAPDGRRLIEGPGHRAQGLVGIGGEQQVALDHQGIGAGLLRRPDHPHVGVALADLHLVDGGGGVVLVGKAVLPVGHRLAQRRLRRGAGGQAHRAPGVGVPAEGQRPVGVAVGIASRRLGRPLEQLPPRKAVGVEGPHLVAAVAGQAARQRQAAGIRHPLHKGIQRHGKIPLPVPQPGRQVPLGVDHTVVGREAVEVALAPGGGLRHENPQSGAGGAVYPVEGHLLPCRDCRGCGPVPPRVPPPASRRRRPGGQVGAGVEGVGPLQAAQGVLPRRAPPKARCRRAGRADTVSWSVPPQHSMMLNFRLRQVPSRALRQAML